MHNKRMKFAHCVRPTRKSEALLLAAYARRSATDRKNKRAEGI